MFSPIEVVPYLTHDDLIVADHARYYLERMRHIAPVDGDAVWRAIDQVSENRWNGLLRLLAVLPPTRDSLARQLEWGTSQRPAGLRYTLLHGLLDLDMATLAQHGEQILAAPLPPHLSRQLRARLELLGKPPAELMQMWRCEIELANAAEDKIADISRIDAIAEAAVLLEPRVAEEAVQIASNPAIMDWREVFAVRMLGLAPHADGVRLLLEKLRQEDGDCLLEGVQHALVRLGTAEVVQAITEVYSGEGWVFRLFAGGSLEQVNLPECETALLQLAEREESIDIRTNLAAGLCAMGSRAGLALAIEMINRQEYDRQVAHLDDDVRGAATMLGVEVPPLPPQRGHAMSMLGFEQRFQAAAAAASAHWLECGEQLDRLDLSDEIDGMQAIDDELPPRIETFVRDEPRIGRNEPCPCGSGKKYKKCCLQMDQSVSASSDEGLMA